MKPGVIYRYDTRMARLANSSPFQIATSGIINTYNLLGLFLQFFKEFPFFKKNCIYLQPAWLQKGFKVEFSIKFIKKQILQKLYSQGKELKAFYHNLLILSSCLRACCLSKMFSSCKRKNLSSSSSRLIRDTMTWWDFMVRVAEVSAKMPRSFIVRSLIIVSKNDNC